MPLGKKPEGRLMLIKVLTIILVLFQEEKLNRSPLLHLKRFLFEFD